MRKTETIYTREDGPMIVRTVTLTEYNSNFLERIYRLCVFAAMCFIAYQASVHILTLDADPEYFSSLIILGLMKKLATLYLNLWASLQIESIRSMALAVLGGCVVIELFSFLLRWGINWISFLVAPAIFCEENLGGTYQKDPMDSLR